MNKEEFIQQLENKLKKLPTEEKENAITYYIEYFAEAGEDKEVEALQELGTPSQIANQIMGEFLVKETDKKAEDKNLKRSLSTIWVVILVIFASPIALPFALTAVILIFVVWILIASFWLIGFSCILAGSLTILTSILTIFSHVPTAIFISGYAMISLGLGIAITIGSKNLFIRYSSWITSKMSKFLLKRGQKNEK